MKVGSADADVGPEGLSSRDKFAAVLKTAALNKAALAEYCQKRGLCQAAKKEKKRVKDLARNKKTLAEAAALLILRKMA